jgi:hypothetical protein
MDVTEREGEILANKSLSVCKLREGLSRSVNIPPRTRQPHLSKQNGVQPINPFQRKNRLFLLSENNFIFEEQK